MCYRGFVAGNRRCSTGSIISDVFTIATARFPRNSSRRHATRLILARPSRNTSLLARLSCSIAYLLVVTHSHPIAIQAGRAAEPRKVCGVVFSTASAVAHG